MSKSENSRTVSRSEENDVRDEQGSFWNTLPGILTGVAAVLGAVTTLVLGLKEVGIIGQREITSAPAVNSESNWTFVGLASTGEDVYVDSQNIQRANENTSFIYKIGDDLVSASTSCSTNQWQISGSNEIYSPQSRATEAMIEYVCKLPQAIEGKRLNISPIILK